MPGPAQCSVGKDTTKLHSHGRAPQLYHFSPKVHYSLAPAHTPRQSTVRLLLHPQLPWETDWAQHASLPDTSITKPLSFVRKPQLLQQPTPTFLVSGLHTGSSETIATSAPILYLHRWRSLPCSGPGPGHLLLRCEQPYGLLGQAHTTNCNAVVGEHMV